MKIYFGKFEFQPEVKQKHKEMPGISDRNFLFSQISGQTKQKLCSGQIIFSPHNFFEKFISKQ
jgi:hypothetical protein